MMGAIQTVTNRQEQPNWKLIGAAWIEDVMKLGWWEWECIAGMSAFGLEEIELKLS